MSYDTTENSLQTAFSAFGAVKSVAIIQDRETGRNKGFGFVEMEEDAEATAAIEKLNGTSIDGRSVTVNEAHPKPAGNFGGGRERRY